MKRILILTAGYGDGHNAAARALAAALTEAGSEVQVRDLFLEAYGKKQEFARGLYLRCIDRAPWAWAMAYHALDYLPMMRFVIAPLLRAVQKLLGRIATEWRPDAVVSVYPGYGYLLDRLYAKTPAPFSRHTLVTDSITVNSVWYRARSDTWLVPNEDTAQVMLKAGLKRQQVHVTGFPVPLTFADDRPERRAPGEGEPLRVLYMINHHRKRAPRLVRRILTLPNVKLTVTVGKDTTLGEELESIAREMGQSIEVHGWTQRLPEILMANHVLIAKAGGATTQEALAACTPVLITKVVPGQELGNAELIEGNGCGAVVKTADRVMGQLEALMRDNFALWHRCIRRFSGFRGRMRRVTRRSSF